ncbi:hypothetical protein XELAEV_18034212mg [Xenopus laevis]|uniref:Uncharacterized protein n=1 Tax=Xenopus laevis TaxID=8355 RepID=A0A974CDF8_XENLA|nr:hypothetical protein XELAEV_18034212mg [Xenopus laevis]
MGHLLQIIIPDNGGFSLCKTAAPQPIAVNVVFKQKRKHLTVKQRVRHITEPPGEGHKDFDGR